MSTVTERLSTSLADRYRIERELGAGGMATVYLAQDLRHDRQVAVKVLRPELAAVIGAERFLAEIKTTANLQHPHILPLHDSGTIDGTVFYVMPFVEGESVRDRLRREKQLPVHDAIRIATEVAGALDYAHRHGVIHRDIKPENILLHDGSALVADFGIALAASNTGSGRMTETGMSLGTPHYMSPEQAMGERDLDARTDVYALGAVIYEMLTGEPPFTGPTAQAIVAKVMTDEPRPPSQLRRTVPPYLERVVLTALEKLPADRFASAAALANALDDREHRAGEAPISRGAAVPTGGRGRARRTLEAAAWLGLGAATTGLLLRSSFAGSGSDGAIQSQVTYSGRAAAPAISPDGRFIAFLEQRCPEPPASGGCVNLEVLEVGTARPVEIVSGADRLVNPRWTHDGLSLVVAGSMGAGREGLFVLPRLGGTPRRIANEPSAYDTHPSADSVAAVFMRDQGAILQVFAITSGEGEPGFPLPFQPVALAWSPDGQRFAASNTGDLRIVDRRGTVLATPASTSFRSQTRWTPDGRTLLMFRWGTGQEDDLVSVPVAGDGSMGRMRVVASHVRALMVGAFDVARTTGRLVVASGAITTDVWSFDLAAKDAQARRLTQGSNWYGSPFLTPDGGSLYYLRADALGNNLYQHRAAREAALTADRFVVNDNGRLSLDERQIAFEAIDDGTFLAIFDISSGTLRRVPRSPRGAGWVIRTGGDIVWLDRSVQSAWVTDSAGGNRRLLAAPSLLPEDRGGVGTGWALAPDGTAIAVAGRTADGLAVVRVPLDGSAAVAIGRFDVAEGAIGIAGWSRDGFIYLSRHRPGVDRTPLLRLRPEHGSVQQYVDLPVRCEPNTVTIAAAGRKATCIVMDQRGDLVVFDGLRP
jgi:Tol biopolymer transport system component